MRAHTAQGDRGRALPRHVHERAARGRAPVGAHTGGGAAERDDGGAACAQVGRQDAQPARGVGAGAPEGLRRV
eukprot:4198412-Prymnesium_polylepis.1